MKVDEFWLGTLTLIVTVPCLSIGVVALFAGPLVAGIPLTIIGAGAMVAHFWLVAREEKR